ncbi:hypothetical protein J1P26_20000 [Neobacillus sp. MM2021_6]|uniref:helix-turn-helix transcriptional regulator n=1 Tax=Bacillaceae TaxID=186817 RepID=UPI00140A10E3|nr:MULTISPECIES: hypothetical protein [Bacillaceae]MBO0961992.1 hypothetical protein [Neobacillus sp. MM2021_6]NHC20312.1 hypothetical protein [Bacillus sp. MM2020_4]
MKGPEPLPIPNHFTVDWYREQKELRKTDHEIAASFFISYALLQKWKRKIGWDFDSKYSGRRLNPHTEKMKELNEQGYKPGEIATMFSVTRETVKNHLKRAMAIDVENGENKWF